MPIPKTRKELIDLVTTSFGKLRKELDDAGPQVAGLPCVDDWSVKDLLAVRAWWTESVVKWIEAGRRGERPVTPAPGYRWRETPSLNASIVRAARREAYESVRMRLERGFSRVIETIGELDDRELLRVGAYEWAGSYPIRRWISLNTARQYTTARAYVRRALRERRLPGRDRREAKARSQPRTGPS